MISLILYLHIKIGIFLVIIQFYLFLLLLIFFNNISLVIYNHQINITTSLLIYYTLQNLNRPSLLRIINK